MTRLGHTHVRHTPEVYKSCETQFQLPSVRTHHGYDCSMRTGQLSPALTNEGPSTPSQLSHTVGMQRNFHSCKRLQLLYGEPLPGIRTSYGCRIRSITPYSLASCISKMRLEKQKKKTLHLNSAEDCKQNQENIFSAFQAELLYRPSKL
jgi:hypothetical protein